MSTASTLSAPSAWLLLAVGDDRQHGGNEGYSDDPPTRYEWDSTVPNHAALLPGDKIALWNKRELLGASVIEQITHGQATKTLFSCRYCGKASIKARKQLSPLYKCYSCKRVFDQPRTRDVEVVTYRSNHVARWVDLSGALAGAELRSLCVRPRSQLSLRPFRWDAFVARLTEQRPDLARRLVAALDSAS